MFKINNTLNSKVIFHSFFLINFIIIIGLLNSSWLGLIAWMIFFMCIYSAKISFNRRKWFAVICITVFCLLIKSFFKTPYITEGSNVFIGGNYEESIFKKKLPPEVFEHLNKDFKKKFPNNISAPSTYLFDNSVSKIFINTPESRKIKYINWSNRYALQLSAFNNTKYNAYGSQQPQRELLPFFVKYTFPIDFKSDKSQLCWKGQAYLNFEEPKSISHSKKNVFLLKSFLKKIKKALLSGLLKLDTLQNWKSPLHHLNLYCLKIYFTNI